MKIIKSSIKVLFILIIVFLAYVLISLIHATLTDFQPKEIIQLSIENKIQSGSIKDSTFSFITWNLGYAGLGAKSDFFFNKGGALLSNGKMVRTSENNVEAYLKLQDDFFKSNEADFYLLQEVDVKSKRNYYNNQFDRISNLLTNYEGTFAVNYDVKRVPVPVLEPHNVMGKVYAGLGTFSRFPNSKATRFQLPGEYEWSTRIFQLDRCIALHRYQLESGKELVVLNIHNSAFDKGGFIKKQQVEYFKQLVLSEYEKGNYVVAGGDWNQCPPNFKFDSFSPENPYGHSQINIENDLFPQGWQWHFDPSIPTNRKTNEVYKKNKTFRTIIDFYLVSPNVEMKEIRCIDLDFQSSDHQPVFLKVGLK